MRVALMKKNDISVVIVRSRNRNIGNNNCIIRKLGISTSSREDFSALIIYKIATKGKYKNYYISLTQYHRWGKIIPYYKTMKDETETNRTFAVPITGSEYDWRGSRRVVKEKEKRCGSVGEGRVDKFKKWWGGLLFIQVQEFAIDGTLIRPT